MSPERMSADATSRLERLHAAVKGRTAFEGINTVYQREYRRQFVCQSCYMKMKIFLRVCIVADFAGLHIDDAFQILDAQTDHCLIVGFHGRNIHNEVAVQNIFIEVQGDTIPQIDFAERTLKDIDSGNIIAFFKGVIAQGFKGMCRCFRVFAVTHDHTLTDGNMLDAMFFQQHHHIFNDPRCRDNAPFWKGHGSGPENDVGFDKNPCLGR